MTILQVKRMSKTDSSHNDHTAKEPLANSKLCADHVAPADFARNDIWRACDFGSVQVRGP